MSLIIEKISNKCNVLTKCKTPNKQIILSRDVHNMLSYYYAMSNLAITNLTCSATDHRLYCKSHSKHLFSVLSTVVIKTSYKSLDIS